MVDQVDDAVCVTDHNASKAPFLLQDRCEEVPVRVGGPAGDRVEGGHDGGNAGVDGSPEGFKVDVPEPLDGNIHRVVVPAAFGLAVGDEVLGAGEDGVRIGEGLPLVAADLRAPRTRC